MKCWFCVIVGVGLFLGASAAPQDAAKKDQERLQGVWQVVSLERDRMPAPQEEIKALKLMVKGDKISHPGPGGKTEEGNFKLDPSQKPTAIDIMPLTGKNSGKTLPGIYSIEGDMLKICVAKGHHVARPTGFKGGDGVVFLVLKRKRA
jgi:uncharacterized protein (TIGR03067 family)